MSGTGCGCPAGGVVPAAHVAPAPCSALATPPPPTVVPLVAAPSRSLAQGQLQAALLTEEARSTRSARRFNRNSLLAAVRNSDTQARMDELVRRSGTGGRPLAVAGDSSNPASQAFCSSCANLPVQWRQPVLPSASWVGADVQVRPAPHVRAAALHEGNGATSPWTVVTADTVVSDLGSTECCDSKEENQTEDIENLRAFSKRCTLLLGIGRQESWRADDYSIRLKACVPKGYMAETSKDDMLKEFARPFHDRMSDDWEALHANFINFSQKTTLGLYWDDGWGFMHRAVLYALNMLQAHPLEDLDLFPNITPHCAYDSMVNKRSFTELIRRGELPLSCEPAPLGFATPTMCITHKGNGFVEVARLDPGGGYTLAAVVTAIGLWDAVRIHAALADYYFWWAHRLHSYHHLESGSVEMWATGMAAARAALAEIAAIAGLIVHEAGHLAGTAAHCQDRFIVAVSANQCCHEEARFIWQASASAKFGLPVNHFYTSASGTHDQNDIGHRFNGKKSASTWVAGPNPVGEEGSCGQGPAWTQDWDESAWVDGRGVRLDWGFPLPCWSTAYDASDTTNVIRGWTV